MKVGERSIRVRWLVCFASPVRHFAQGQRREIEENSGVQLSLSNPLASRRLLDRQRGISDDAVHSFIHTLICSFKRQQYTSS